MTTAIHDLLVVGAGPVGCRVAAGVARAGRDVVILEQKSTPDLPVCCTALVSDECLGHFGLAPGLILRSFKAATTFPPAGEAISVNRDRVQAHVLDRPALDQWLGRAAEEQGASCLFGCRVSALSRDDKGITAGFIRDGRKDSMRARAVVLAAGFGSSLLGELGIKRASDWTMGVQAEAGVADEIGVEVYVGRAYAPGFFAWLVPTTAGRAHVGLMANRRTKTHFEAYLARLQKDGKVSDCTQPTFRGITLARPSRTYGDRLLVVGDLAGQVKPITGGGLYFGLLCADIAARHLVSALDKDSLSARMLKAYEREWYTLLGRELRMGRWARRAFGILGDRQLSYLFGWARRRALAERLARDGGIGFDWHSAAISRAGRLLNPFSRKESA